MKFFGSSSVSLSSEHHRYALRGLLKGQHGAVSCVATHPLGTFVASGGEAGTKVWHLPSAKAIPGPTGASDRGITTAIVWLMRPDDEEEGLAYGTEHGYLCIWRRNKDGCGFTEIFCDRLVGGADGAEVSGMAYDTSSGQLAVVHRAEAVHRFLIDIGMIPRVIKSVTIAKHWPQAVAFGQVGVKGPELWSFGREDGVIHILNDEGRILRSKTTGMVIGHAVLNTKDDAVILDDVSQGVALMKLAGTERVKTFEVPHQERRSRNVAFQDGTSTIIVGSDHGNVYAFDRRTGEVIDTIYIGLKDWVQSISTVDLDGVPLIIVGRSGENIGTTELQVWQKVVTTPVGRSAARKEEGRWLLLILLSCILVFENILKIPVLSYGQKIVISIVKQYGL
ncbi:hypothetical protein D9757_014492 [Collybiopsis confluens]|uniref:Uncharacterized protein n=1 Tax=Collybiopsis confluens TaxID=2823264 RepID=A0A8H5CNX2_9AGAR|nr:hypothetical protein D9757_014492 [Collybiopsis confluens]